MKRSGAGPAVAAAVVIAGSLLGCAGASGGVRTEAPANAAATDPAEPVAATAAPAAAAAPPPGRSEATASPYAGLDARDIKALDDAEVASLLAGEGLGFAQAAELNGIPGPRHVLDAADALALTDEQRRRVQEVFDAMQADAVRLGRELVEAERALDRRLAGGQATPAEVEARVVALGTLRGRLRNVHLQAHLQTAPLLTDHQRMLYRRIRGYGEAGHGNHHDEAP